MFALSHVSSCDFGAVIMWRESIIAGMIFILIIRTAVLTDIGLPAISFRRANKVDRIYEFLAFVDKENYER